MHIALFSVPLLPMLGIVRLVTGPLGTGKSYFGVRCAVAALRSGSMVVTNFDLVPDWTDQVARHGRGRRRSKKYDELSDLYRTRYRRVHSMAELSELRVRPEPPFATEIYPGKWAVKEGSVICILDESHRWMNARTWSKEGRGDLLEFFALARKRGFIIYLLAQRKDNLDVQVRELFEDHIILKNLRRSLRVFGMRVCPWNIFIAGWFSHHYGNECVRTDRYFLGWDKALYDTTDTVSFHEGESTDAVTYLPVWDVLDEAEQPPPAALPPAAAGPVGPAPRQTVTASGTPTLEGDPAAPVLLIDPAGDFSEDRDRF